VLRDPDPFGLGRAKWHADAVEDLVLIGNAIGDMRSRQADGVPDAVPLWEPERVVWARDPSTGLHRYEVLTDDPERRITVDPVDVWHAAVGGRSGHRMGTGILQQYPTQLRIMAAVEDAQFVVMRSGRPVGVLSVDADMVPEELRDAKAAFIDGVNADGIAALVKAKFEPVSWNATDLALVPAREFGMRTAALITGVPAYMLGVPSSNRTYSNVESEWRNFVTLTLLRYVRALEDAWSKPFPRHTSVRYNVDSLFQAEALARWQTYALQASLGATSVEEIRQEETMGPMLGSPFPTTQEAP
jgi:HK97 family phage portal protein